MFFILFLFISCALQAMEDFTVIDKSIPGKAICVTAPLHLTDHDFDDEKAMSCLEGRLEKYHGSLLIVMINRRWESLFAEMVQKYPELMYHQLSWNCIDQLTQQHQEKTGTISDYLTFYHEISSHDVTDYKQIMDKAKNLHSSSSQE